jgi:hypothetical protein
MTQGARFAEPSWPLRRSKRFASRRLFANTAPTRGARPAWLAPWFASTTPDAPLLAVSRARGPQPRGAPTRAVRRLASTWPASTVVSKHRTNARPEPSRNHVARNHVVHQRALCAVSRARRPQPRRPQPRGPRGRSPPIQSRRARCPRSTIRPTGRLAEAASYCY